MSMKNLLGKINTRNSIFLIALAMSGMHQNALANATANASASNFRYALTDLTPDDGIAPSLSWIPSPDYGYASLIGSYWSDVVFSARPDSDALVTKEWVQGGDAVSASMEGATQLGTTAISTSATSAGSPFIAFWTEASARSQLGAFVLSPGSAVSFMVDYSLNGLITDSLLEYSQARAEAILLGELYGAGGIEVGIEQDSAFTSASNFTTDGQVRNGTLSLTMSNAGGAYSEGTIRFDTEAYAMAVINAPIPEPSTWAMLLGGLALLPVIRKRR